MDLDSAFRAVADPTRRAILQRLAHGAATTGQLAALFPKISRPAVSQHLKVLREAHLIRVASLDDARRRVVEHGGSLVVEPFVIQGVGRGCYFTDPAGLLVGLHEYDPEAR